MDTLTQEERSKRMGLVRSKNTKPELIVRKLIHALGYRYRLHRRDLPGKPDLVFAKKRKVIFVHGCFWHRHENSGCALTRTPKTRLEFWNEKFERNKERDCESQQQLLILGWRFLVVWECELSDLDRVSGKIKKFLDE